MTQITPYLVWIGHAGEGRDFRQLFGRGIRAVVDLAVEEAPVPPPRELVYLRVPLLDGAGNDAAMLLLAVHALTALLKRHIPTLVVCGGGMSRSPAMVAAALAAFLHESPEACLQRVIQQHPHDVSPALWQELVETLERSPEG